MIARRSEEFTKNITYNTSAGTLADHGAVPRPLSCGDATLGVAWGLVKTETFTTSRDFVLLEGGRQHHSLTGFLHLPVEQNLVEDVMCLVEVVHQV